jgi:hypothetical protein
MKKIIVIGVIALFICVGFQSAFATDNNNFICNENQQIENNIFIFLLRIFQIMLIMRWSN